MTFTISQRVKQIFNPEALRDEAKARLTGRQWEQRKALVDRCDKARNKAEELNSKRYLVRVEVARKKLIDEAGSKTKELKPLWAPNDRFNKEETLRLAQHMVKQEHERRIAQINQYETRGLTNLLATAKRENQLQGKAERPFKQVADRRQLPTRRIDGARRQER